MSFLIGYGKTSSQSGHRRQKVDVKYEGRRRYLLYPLITPLSLTQTFHEERILFTVQLWLKGNVNKQVLAIRNISIPYVMRQGSQWESLPFCFALCLLCRPMVMQTHWSDRIHFERLNFEGRDFSRDMREEAQNRQRAVCATIYMKP